MKEQPHIGDIVQIETEAEGTTTGIVLGIRADDAAGWEAAELLVHGKQQWLSKADISQVVGRLKGISRIDQPSRRTHGWFVRVYDGKKARASRLFSDQKYHGIGAALEAALAFHAAASAADAAQIIPAPAAPRAREPRTLQELPKLREPARSAANQPPDGDGDGKMINSRAGQTVRVTPVEIPTATRRGERYHLTRGNGYTLCHQPCSTGPAPSDLTFLPHRDCQRCVLELRRLALCCPSCDQPLFQVAPDGRCLTCARASSPYYSTTSVGA